MPDKRRTVNDFRRMKEEGTPITALTAYDAIFARLLDQAGIDIILVGDSLANSFQGIETTLPVTIEEMIYHATIVARSVYRAFTAVDMPFLSFQINADETVRNAGTIMKKSGCQAVKLEGGLVMAPTIRRLVDSGIPVIGHVGLTPQSVHVFGGYDVRGRGNRQAVLDDAHAVENAGAFAIVLEKIPKNLSSAITEELTIPTIGIGAGNDCDGQILVTSDMLGLNPDFNPSFVRKYGNLAEETLNGVKKYIEDVQSKSFPDDSESYE